MTAPEPWWKAAVGYQVYPASFCDSNGDGIGDIPGIISKLDYLAELGIGFIWLSPVYASPMVDNGYDISDYRAINPVFGALDDMDRLISEARARDIGIVMDLVVNHTSDQHPWFQAARVDPQAPTRDYYIWRNEAPEAGSAEDLPSIFGGSAWSQPEGQEGWHFHLFAPEQPDLNWANPKLRAEIHAMMNWWFDRGIAGFRMDVIDLIGKDPGQGISADGPRLHEYLQEMHRETLEGRDVLTVGEAWSATPDNAPLFSDPARNELSMVFQFEHVTAFWDTERGKWDAKPIDLPVLKEVLARWQVALHGRGWNSLFWGNHDLPRAVSRFGDDGPNRIASAKALATVLHLMEGTPFVYQGEEIGMTNAGFTSLGQYRDVETLNAWPICRDGGMNEDEFLAAARVVSRDNARTPMQWSAQHGAGFTSGEPWIAVNPNHETINVAADRADPDGVFQHYRRLIAMRRDLAEVRGGSFELLLPDDEQVFAYRRVLGEAEIIVIANCSGQFVQPGLLISGVDLLSGKRIAFHAETELAPWQSLVVRPD